MILGSAASVYRHGNFGLGTFNRLDGEMSNHPRRRTAARYENLRAISVVVAEAVYHAAVEDAVATKTPESVVQAILDTVWLPDLISAVDGHDEGKPMEFQIGDNVREGMHIGTVTDVGTVLIQVKTTDGRLRVVCPWELVKTRDG
jgi:hypothetical protein